MSRKRSYMPDAYRNRKRICTAQKTQENNSAWDKEDDLGNTTLPTDTKAALLYIRSLFPHEKFEDRIPPILLKHQLYGVINSRTKVDREVGDLRQTGEVRLFKLGSDANEFCVVFTEDYKFHVLKFCSTIQVNKLVINKFFDTVISNCQDVSLSQQKMMHEFHFSDDDITQLMKAGVLTVRDAGSWWLAIPSAGVFMKSFIRGRKAVLTMIRKCKYTEILQQELEQRKLPKVARLGMTYHILDLIGADLVEKISTTSGVLLRLKET